MSAKTLHRRLAGLSGIIAAVLWLTAPAAQAIPIEFTAALSGPNESPPNSSPGTGTAVIDFDLATNLTHVHVTFQGLTANTTALHIHCCTTTPFTGTARVATTTPTFASFRSG